MENREKEERHVFGETRRSQAIITTIQFLL